MRTRKARVRDFGAFALLALCLCGAGRQEKVDLLKLVDLKRDAVAGEWKVEEGKLVTPGKRFARVQVPYVPPAEYDLTAVVERQDDESSVILGLALGEVQFLAILNGNVDGEYRSGLDRIDNKPFYENPTVVKGAVLGERKAGTVVCSVRKARITVAVDGKKIVDWPVDAKRLSLYNDWRLPRRDTLLVGSWYGVVKYSKLELTPVSGEGKPLR